MIQTLLLIIIIGIYIVLLYISPNMSNNNLLKGPNNDPSCILCCRKCVIWYIRQRHAKMVYLRLIYPHTLVLKAFGWTNMRCRLVRHRIIHGIKLRWFPNNICRLRSSQISEDKINETRLYLLHFLCHQLVQQTDTVEVQYCRGSGVELQMFD